MIDKTSFHALMTVTLLAFSFVMTMAQFAFRHFVWYEMWRNFRFRQEFARTFLLAELGGLTAGIIKIINQ